MNSGKYYCKEVLYSQIHTLHVHDHSCTAFPKLAGTTSGVFDKVTDYMYVYMPSPSPSPPSLPTTPLLPSFFSFFPSLATCVSYSTPMVSHTLGQLHITSMYMYMRSSHTHTHSHSYLPHTHTHTHTYTRTQSYTYSYSHTHTHAQMR